MNPVNLLKIAYDHGVKIALNEAELPEYIAAKEAGVQVETPGMPVERLLHHDVTPGQAARFGSKGREVEHKRAEEEPDYVSRARDYADRYHKSLLARFKSEHEAKLKPSLPPKPEPTSSS